MTTMTKPEIEKLPELPEVECWWRSDTHVYSADQMRAYALAAIRAQGGGDAVGEVSDGWCGPNRTVRWYGVAPPAATKLYTAPAPDAIGYKRPLSASDLRDM